MTYGKSMGTQPKLIFRPTSNDEKMEENGDPIHGGETIANTGLLPVEVRRRKDGLPPEANRQFDIDKYYSHLTSKHFGRALLFVPVCTSTMDVSDRYRYFDFNMKRNIPILST
jgi:hypothetical protein